MAVVRESIPVLILLLVLNCTILVFTQPENQPLTPPYFNLAQEQDIEATATCGVGVSSPELFCKLTGATSEYINHRVNTDGVQIVEGQNCDVCVQPGQEGSIASNREHPARFAIDGTERWWQSPPLSRDMKYNEVNLTINLGQVITNKLYTIDLTCISDTIVFKSVKYFYVLILLIRGG